MRWNANIENLVSLPFSEFGEDKPNMADVRAANTHRGKEAKNKKVIKDDYKGWY